MCTLLTWPIRAFCQILNNIIKVLFLEQKDVRKYLSVPVEINIAFGITRAVFSLVIDVTSLQRIET